MTNHRPKHFKPLKWEDGDDWASAKVKAPFILKYSVFEVYFEDDSTSNKKLYRLYTDTHIDCARISYYTNPERLYSTIPEAKAYAEQHYQSVMAKLEKAIEKLRLRR